MLDGDGSLDPGGAARAWPPWSPPGEADLAVGRRVPQARAWPWHARAGNAVIAAPLRRRGVPVHDLAPVRVARRAALLGLGVADRASATRSSCCCAPARRDGGSAEVPVAYRPRAGGRSKVSGSLRGTVRATRDMAGLLR